MLGLLPPKRSLVALALAVGGAGALAPGCRAPTKITVEVSTDLPCSSLKETTVAISRRGADEATAYERTTRCLAGQVGTLVVVPGDEQEIAVEVVAGVDHTVEECAENNYKDCIVARRTVRFVSHEALTVRVDLSEACLGVVCGDGSTCIADGTCASAAIPDPERCTGDGCGEEVLGPGQGGEGGAAGQGGSAGKGGAGQGGASGAGQGGSAGQAGAGQGGVSGQGGSSGQGGAGASGSAGSGGASGSGGAGQGGVSGASGSGGQGGSGGAGSGGAGAAGSAGEGGASGGGQGGSSGATQEGFQWLPDVGGKALTNVVISGDGNVVFGSNQEQVFRWTSAGGWETLSPTSKITLAAADAKGTVLVGTNDTTVNAGTPTSVGWAWTPQKESTLTMPSKSTVGQALGVSQSGQYIVGQTGTSLVSNNMRGAIWTRAGGSFSLSATLPDPSFGASQISEDGKVVVGSGSFGGAAFRWSQFAGVKSFPPVSSGVSCFFSYAFVMSSDGSRVAGSGCYADSQAEALRWTVSNPITGVGSNQLLGFVGGGGTPQSVARCISADGARVVGVSTSGATSGATIFVWEESKGMQDARALVQWGVPWDDLVTSTSLIYLPWSFSRDCRTAAGLGATAAQPDQQKPFLLQLP